MKHSKKAADSFWSSGSKETKLGFCCREEIQTTSRVILSESQNLQNFSGILWNSPHFSSGTMNFQNIPLTAISTKQFSARTWGKSGNQNKQVKSKPHTLLELNANKSQNYSVLNLSLHLPVFHAVCFLTKNILSICQSGFMYSLDFSYGYVLSVCLFILLTSPLY